MALIKNNIPNKDVNSDVTQEAPVYCICRSSMINVFMIKCDFCEEWYHGDCIRITEKESEMIDEFCCQLCKRKNPSLRTTYKNRDKCKKNSTTKRKCEKLTSKNYRKISTSNQNSAVLNAIKTPAITANEAPTNTCFQFVDTTIRKAKTEAYKKFNQSSIPEKTDKIDKMQSEKTKLKQCYGPGCTKSSRKGSKYCSDACGITLARHRILEILPQRIQQWNSTPSAADELSCKKLADIRAKLHNIEKQLEELEKKIIKLHEIISKSKNPANQFIEEQCDDTISTDCVLCGLEMPYKLIQKHLEQCYIKLEKKVTTDDKFKPTDEKWDIFCNRKIAKNSWCKKIKVLCPFHYENFRKADEVCGYFLGEANGINRYCGNKGRTCSHLNWEEIQRANLDLEKLNLLLKFQDLKDEEEKIRREMSRRGEYILVIMSDRLLERKVLEYLAFDRNNPAGTKYIDIKLYVMNEFRGIGFVPTCERLQQTLARLQEKQLIVQVRRARYRLSPGLNAANDLNAVLQQLQQAEDPGEQHINEHPNPQAPQRLLINVILYAVLYFINLYLIHILLYRTL